MNGRSDLLNLINEKKDLDFFLSSIVEAISSGTSEEKTALPDVTANPLRPESQLADSVLDTEMILSNPDKIPPLSIHEDEMVAKAADEYTTEKISDRDQPEYPPTIPEGKFPYAYEHQEKTMSPVPPHKTETIETINSEETITPRYHFAVNEMLPGRTSTGINMTINEPMSGDRNTEEERKTFTGQASDNNRSSREPDTDKHENQPEKSGSSTVEAPREHKKIWVISGTLLIMALAIAAAFTWSYSDKDGQILQWIASEVPFIDQYLGDGQTQKNAAPSHVGFLHVRQRLVYNTVLERNIRIIEGMAENQTKFAISKIKVMGELYDSSALMLNAKVSLCGNIVSNDDLANLSEEGIQSILTTSTELSTSKVPPKGQIPFMIIFTHEPDGIAKATVMPIGFEKSE
jgi:hypothetical protein